MQKQRRRPLHYFTLVELLVVLAVLSILAGLLLPALSKAIRKAKEVACINNLKNLGIGIFAYGNDYRRYYPDKSKATNLSDHGADVYKGRRYAPPSARVGSLVPIVEDYYGGREGMEGAYMCPFVANGIRAAEMDPSNNANDGRFPYTYQPGGSSSWQWKSVGSYNIYFSAYSKGTYQTIIEPMRKIGKPWRWNRANYYGRVVASDKMTNGQYEPNSNHPPEAYPSEMGLTWIWKEGMRSVTDRSGPSKVKNGPGWYFGKSPYSSYCSTSASYLLDDWSVHLEPEMRYDESELGLVNDKNYLFPKRLISDRP